MELIVNTSENALVLRDGDREESYAVDRVPEASSSLVQRGKQEILQELSLDAVLTNLERSGDLLFVPTTAWPATGAAA